jgi:glycosyltransferase involved in cell wall biosynthesis
MRLAIVSTMCGSPWGGSEELWASLATAALSRNCEVILSVEAWPTIPLKITALQTKGAILLRRMLRPRPSRLGRLLQRGGAKVGVSRWRSLLRQKPSFVVISQGWTWEYGGLDIAERLTVAGIPYSQVFHSDMPGDIVPPDIRARMAKCVAKARWVGFVAEASRRLTERQLAQAIPNAIILKNPVNLGSIEPVAWPQGDSVQMAFVGRIETRKGIEVLIEVLGGTAWKQRDWRLNLYGTITDPEYYNKLVAYYGVSDRVIFHDHTNDIRSVWASNHLLILPSFLESAPLTIVEAMLCGRPGVVTDVGGCTEWIEDEVTGFVAECATVRYVGRALERAWAARQRWEEMGRLAHDAALRKYDPDPGSALFSLLLESAHA